MDHLTEWWTKILRTESRCKEAGLDIERLVEASMQWEEVNTKFSAITVRDYFQARSSYCKSTYASTRHTGPFHLNVPRKRVR